MELQRGMRVKLDQYANLNSSLEVEMQIYGPSVYDFCCFGVDARNKLSDDRYMIFYNQTSSPQGEITYRNAGNTANFFLNLFRLPNSIQKLVFTVSIDGNSTMRMIQNHTFTLKQNGNSLLHLQLCGGDFRQEKAIITVELYRKDAAWRINTIASGFDGGLSDLLHAYGGKEVTASSAPVPTPQPVSIPTPTRRPQPVTRPTSFLDSGPIRPRPQSVIPPQPQKVNLQKGQKVSLVKGSHGLGEILINLNWKQPRGLFAHPIDLDLGCLYELKDGSKGTVQALGNKFGSLTSPPYIALDGDDRSGASANGENLRINGQMVPKIKRVLIYTFIYDGIANWKGADGVVTVKCPGSPEIVVHMDEYGSRLTLCAIALLENVNDTLCVEKIVNFYKDQEYADRAFGWGLHWTPGRK